MKKKDSKKSKKNGIAGVAKKVAAGSALSGILLSSCVKDYLPIGYQESDFFGKIKNNNTTAKHLLDRQSISLSTDFRDYVTIINFIINDIITNRKSAELFINNFEEYIAKHELSNLLTNPDFKFEITDKDKRLLMAFTDEEIFTAINNLDFELFLDLSLSKGYIVGPESVLQERSLSDYRHFFNTQEDFDQYMEILKAITNNQDLRVEAEWVGAVGVGFLAVAAIVAAVVSAVAIWVSSDSMVEQYQRVLGEKEPVLNLWFNANPNTLVHYENIINDKLVIQRAQKIVEAIYRTNPGINQELLLEFVILNFNAYYYGDMQFYTNAK